MSELLFEIGTEEIPAGYLQPALKAMEKTFIKRAKELQLSHGSVTILGTPRRMVLHVKDLVERQEDKVEELIGPSKAAGFDESGEPTKAALGFARSKGADVTELKVIDTEKGEYLMLKREVKGQATAQLLPEVLATMIEVTPFPKSMIWGANRERFARPIQWLTALLDNTVLPVTYTGLTSSNTTKGHRFHGNEERVIPSADLDQYTYIMESLEVIVDFEKRRELVLTEVESAVQQQSDLKGAQVSIDHRLADIVTNLVEKPFGICGKFSDKFLELPPEVLITSMREHQKYFPVVDTSGALLPSFVAVNNTKVADSNITRKGHERVLRARLEDAYFFFETDKQVSLEKRAERLSEIIFHAKLGTMAEKVSRIEKLAVSLAGQIAPDQAENCAKAAKVCKADLLSEMVTEFPSLQGIMGGAYAIHEGLTEDIATAIKEHYMPLRAGAEVSDSQLACLIGLADRFDTLAGCFGIGQVPTGTTDPFGLRRIVLAILQIIRHGKYNLSLTKIVKEALANYGGIVAAEEDTVEKIMEFIKNRFINDQVSSGADQQAVEAVTSVQFDDVIDVMKRIDAFMTIKKEPAFAVLSGSFKRIRNISKDNSSINVDDALLTEAAEKKLYTTFVAVQKNVSEKLSAMDYQASLQVMLELEKPVDTFFEEVMVMSDDQSVRQNRLNLLTAISQLVLQVGDISKMQDG